MSEKNTTVDNLDALKARHTQKVSSERTVEKDIHGQRRSFLAPYLWRLFGVLLALFCGIFLTLSYRQSLNIRERESVLRNKVSQIKEYETRIVFLSDEIGKFSAQRERLRKETNILVGDAAKYAEAAASNRLLSNSLPKLKKEREALEKAVSRLQSKKSSLQGEIKEYQTRLDSITTSYQKDAEQLDKLKNKLSVTRTKLDGLATTAASKTATLEGVLQKIKNKQNHLNELTAALNGNKKEQKELKNSITVLRTSISASEQTISSLRAEEALLNKDIQIGKKKMARMVLQITAASEQASKMEMLETQVEIRDEKLTAKRQQLRDIQQSISEATNAFEQLRQNAANMQTSITVSKKSIDDLRSEKFRLDEEIKVEKIELSRISVRMQSDRQKATDLENRKNNIAKKIIQLEVNRQQLIAMLNDVVDAKSELSSIETKLKAQDIVLAKRNQEVVLAEDKSKKLQAIIHDLEEIRLRLEKNVSNLLGQQKALNNRGAPKRPE